MHFLKSFKFTLRFNPLRNLRVRVFNAQCGNAAHFLLKTPFALRYPGYQRWVVYYQRLLLFRFLLNNFFNIFAIHKILETRRNLIRCRPHILKLCTPACVVSFVPLGQFVAADNQCVKFVACLFDVLECLRVLDVLI